MEENKKDEELELTSRDNMEIEEELSTFMRKEDQQEEQESLSDRVKVLTPGRMVARRFFRSKLSVIGLIVLLLLFLFAFVGPLFSPYGEKTRDTSPGLDQYMQEAITLTDANGQEYTVYKVTITPRSINMYAPPSAEHWLGTDQLAMDVFTRVMYGGRISLTLSFMVIFLQTFIGIVLGGLSGYFGRWVDQLVMRIVDVLNCLPTIPIMLIVGAALDGWIMKDLLPESMRIYVLMLMLTLMGWAGTARLVRGQILMLREQEFMIAAEASGLSVKRKIFKHLVPNVLPQLIVSMTLGLGGVILTESTLSYLGSVSYTHLTLPTIA